MFGSRHASAEFAYLLLSLVMAANQLARSMSPKAESIYLGATTNHGTTHWAKVACEAELEAVCPKWRDWLEVSMVEVGPDPLNALYIPLYALYLKSKV
jgi:hypothetical protein